MEIEHKLQFYVDALSIKRERVGNRKSHLDHRFAGVLETTRRILFSFFRLDLAPRFRFLK